MKSQELSYEIRRITNETAALAASEALRVSEIAKAKAAEVSTLAIAEALKAATLAATKAAEAAAAAATIAASTGKDLEYIKSDISDTKSDIKDIKDKLDNKYVTKNEYSNLEKRIIDIIAYQINFMTKEEGVNLSRKVDGVTENITWFIRIVIGVVIVAVLGLVIVNK